MDSRNASAVQDFATSTASECKSDDLPLADSTLSIFETIDSGSSEQTSCSADATSSCFLSAHSSSETQSPCVRSAHMNLDGTGKSFLSNIM